MWSLGTSLVAAVVLFLCLKKADRPGNDDADGFLVSAALCIPALSAGVFALWTGVYPELERRGLTNKFYRVAGSRMRWVPWTQVIAAQAHPTQASKSRTSDSGLRIVAFPPSPA